MVVAKPAITTLGMTAGKTKMNKLEELIKELCPDGVEYRKLKDASIMQRGTSLTKANSIEGEFPVISGGKEPAFYCNQYNRDGETITVAGSGAGAGFVQYWTIPLFANDCFTLKAIENNSTKYVYYFLTSIQNKINDTKKGGGVPHVHISDIENFEIPVPPLEVQKEIVRILDTFTELEKELEKELVLRKKQYEYYRDHLLTFDNNVEWKKIKDVYKRLKGTPITAGKMKEIACADGEIRIFAGGKTVIDAHESDIPNANITKVPAVLVQSRGVIDAVFYDKPFTFKNEMWAYTNDKIVSVKYLYYVLKNNMETFRNAASGMGSLPQISLTVTEDFLIPLPPLAEQERIVSILDRFDSLCNSLTSGLPAEIEARRRQYQYYRDKLLSFKRC